MKKMLFIVPLFAAVCCLAQVTDPVTVSAARYFKEAQQAAKNQAIWNKPLYGPTLFVNPQSRMAWANMPDDQGVLKPDGEVYKGTLPNDIIIANTAINWQGKKWSVIQWPLPQNHDERLNLVMHESFHRIQHDLGLPDRSPTINHLATMDGRIYFLLELQALKAALAKPANQRRADLANALLFREKRRRLFPATFGNEQLLEMNEGVAEYTGVMLGRQKDSIREHLYQVIDGADKTKSLIRSMAYVTGPVYGYLLYQKAPRWTMQVDSNSSFPALISKYYQVDLPAGNIDAKIAASLKLYNGDAIIASEKLKEAEHQKQAAEYIELFTHKPVLTITAVNMSIGFNPSNLFDLGDYGTVYPTAEVKDAWGELEVTEGGMLMKDWKWIYLPISDNVKPGESHIEGAGWKLTLNAGWKIEKDGAMNYKMVKTD
jgi:hypothetical protein